MGSPSSKLASLLSIGLAALAVCICLFPLLYALLTSFKTGSELFSSALMPTQASLENYRALFSGGQSFGRHLINSIMVASLTVTGSLVLSLGAAYALGRVNFAGKSLLLMTILAVSMFPQVAVLSGMFELMQMLGLYNRAVGLVVPYAVFTLPFTVWILTTFMRELPLELEEAAIMDGCGPLRIIMKVFMPLLWPAMASTGLLAFIGAWNEFLFALSFMIGDDQRTVPVGISMIAGNSSFEIPWGTIMAASIIVTLPLLALVLVFQQRIVSGLTAGAIKG
ncbi:MAG: carbohydrate ABC transporter permease [Betaproteobacteria bacterium]|jgi:trehalose/maltose transport system permease protein